MLIIMMRKARLWAVFYKKEQKRVIKVSDILSTQDGRVEEMRSRGLYGRSVAGEFGEETLSPNISDSASDRGIWASPGGRPNTVRAT